jgi:hypothetical protein
MSWDELRSLSSWPGWTLAAGGWPILPWLSRHAGHAALGSSLGTHKCLVTVRHGGRQDCQRSSPAFLGDSGGRAGRGPQRAGGRRHFPCCSLAIRLKPCSPELPVQPALATGWKREVVGRRWRGHLPRWMPACLGVKHGVWAALGATLPLLPSSIAHTYPSRTVPSCQGSGSHLGQLHPGLGYAMPSHLWMPTLEPKCSGHLISATKNYPAPTHIKDVKTEKPVPGEGQG